MGTGSYLPREKARRLLEQRGNTTLAKDRFKVIDMYFSIWTNQYPYQLVNYLTPLDQKNDWGTERVSDHWGVVFRNMVSISFPFLLHSIIAIHSLLYFLLPSRFTFSGVHTHILPISGCLIKYSWMRRIDCTRFC